MQCELLHDGDSCESRPRMLYIFDVLGPLIVDECCCSVACCAVACCCGSMSLSRRPRFFLLLCPTLFDGDEVPVSVFDLVDELLDPVVVSLASFLNCCC